MVMQMWSLYGAYGQLHSVCVFYSVPFSLHHLQPILMAPIQVVELTSVPPELRNDSRCRSSNTASSQQRRRQSPGVLDYYGFRRSKGMDNLPWLVRFPLRTCISWDTIH